MKRDEVVKQIELFTGYLRENGLRMTRQRKTIVEGFLSVDGHVSTDELFDLVKNKDKSVGYTTVFRTLKALKDCGLARETFLSDGRTRFEHRYHRPYHHHIVCQQCNNTIEFSSPELEALQEQIVSKYHFRSLRHQLQIFGVCENCQKDQTVSQDVWDSDLVFARDALKIALEAERSGVNFYSSAAETMTKTSGKETFLRIAEDENEHLRGLQKEFDQLIKNNKNLLKAPVFLHFDYGSLKKIFPTREELKHRYKNDRLEEKEALLLAMEMEKESFRFFKDYAQRFNETRGKEIFLKFAEEEEDHYRTIQQEYQKFLQQNT